MLSEIGVLATAPFAGSGWLPCVPHCDIGGLIVFDMVTCIDPAYSCATASIVCMNSLVAHKVSKVTPLLLLSVDCQCTGWERDFENADASCCRSQLLPLCFRLKCPASARLCAWCASSVHLYLRENH